MNLPLRIKRNAESYEVVDASGRRLSFTHYEDEPVRRDHTGRVTEAEALEIAKVIARALTDAKEAERL